MDSLSVTDYATTFERELSLNAPRENKTGSLNVYIFEHMLHKGVFIQDFI